VTATGSSSVGSSSGWRSLDWHVVRVGDELPALVVEVTATRIVAGAIATRDFMPVHHDRDYANQQGAPDIFMNILSDTAYCSRFLTDWAGPDARITHLAIRLGVPVFPGHTMTYTGSVTGRRIDGDEGVVEVALTCIDDLGEHVSGTATLALSLHRPGDRPADRPVTEAPADHP
jgi:acyl dehydratase